MITKPKAKKFRIRRSVPLSLAIAPTAEASGPPVAMPTLSVVGTEGSALADPPAALAPVRLRTRGNAPVAAPGESAAPSAPVLLTPPPVRERPQPDMSIFNPTDDGFGDDAFLTAMPQKTAVRLDPASEKEIDAIRRESLTGRQLRMARRMAQKHGLPATSDFDAVRLLRRQGIDPFQRSNMLELVVGSGDPKSDASALVQLPQTTKPAGLPSTETVPGQRRPEPRVDDIMQIQRDLAKRRRKKTLLLLTRLLFFVMLPTIATGFYYYSFASPFYATKSEFVIQKADAPATGLGAGLLAGTAFATATDSITVQGYLQSRDAMARLDTDLGFKTHFSQPTIDNIQRLPEGATNEAAYKLYRRNVKIGFDPTEGIIRMEVIAADPATSAAFAKALIGYAEEQVDHLTQRVREDQMSGARTSYNDSEQKMLEAQRRVVALQEKFKVLSSETEVAMIATQLSQMETLLITERLRLQELLANQNPSSARVDPVKQRISSLEAEIATTRAKMTETPGGGASLAEIQSDLLVAQADVQTRQIMLAQSLQSLETARVEANRQTRYLSVSVSPIAPDEATYPRAFENTIVAFMIFGGIYLMISMTASILREQITA